MRIPWAGRGSSTVRAGITAGRRAEVAAAAGTRDRPRGRLPAERDRLGAAASVTAATTARRHAARVRRAECRSTSLTATAGARSTGPSGSSPATCAPTRSRSSTARPQRFIDNGWYVGHDEPSVKFISSTPGSGNTMTYLTKVPVDPRGRPTPSGSVTNYGQLSVAPWFGLPMCDPNSYPQNPCTPDSDTNSGSISDPNAAGSAFMELQLYPPGYTPFVDSESCSKTKWCAALTIDSLECTSTSPPATPTARSRLTSPTCRPTASPPGRRARSSPTSARFLPNRQHADDQPG